MTLSTTRSAFRIYESPSFNWPSSLSKLLLSAEGMRGMCRDGNDVMATMASWCCYDVTAAASMASELIALYPAATTALVINNSLE